MRLVLLILFTTSIFSKEISFPKDHSFHPDFGLEWCYFVGNLQDDSGKSIGYELSFFKAKISEKEEIFPVHFAISNIDEKKHITSQVIERRFGNLAGYNSKEIYSGDYSVKFLSSTEFQLKAEPRNSKIKLNLLLSISSTSDILLHGEKGYSLKSRKYPEVFSYYYSIPRLVTKGSIWIEQKEFIVKSGTSWMDHEWSSQGKTILNSPRNLSSSENSWDWLCLNLSDGSDLMVFNFRKNANEEPETFGTLSNKKEKIYFKDIGSISLVPNGKKWKSGKTKKDYQLNWKIFSKGLELEIAPNFQEQEFIAIESTGNIYWEGSVQAQGKKDSAIITGKGYLELKGQ
ncbi:MAG: lipocalin-like domain-containing protein [Leptospiraceae bacterium]|nr:lipocalin-like domain-containing protein [Leptospiraceae bacterium]